MRKSSGLMAYSNGKKKLFMVNSGISSQASISYARIYHLFSQKDNLQMLDSVYLCSVKLKNKNLWQQKEKLVLSWKLP